MGLSSVASIALQSLREQAQNLESTASNIANAESGVYQAHDGHASVSHPGENADLATEMLNLSEEEATYRANAEVFEAGADLWQILGVVTRD
jgi:flagellar basal body rod protein FlgC